MPTLSVDQALAGREIKIGHQAFYMVEPEPETLHPDLSPIIAGHRRFHPDAPDRRESAGPDFKAIENLDPAQWLYLDIETTGLTGVPLFLVGLMYFDRKKLRIEQLLARDYSEEEPLLAFLAEKIQSYTCFITFNGKTFDIPYIRDRYFANAIRCRFPTRHLDLLGLSRRRWRDRLPNCRLQTIERWVCGRRRDGDIPGSDIPDTYHLFVNSGNGALLRPILEHNALDLITMGDVLMRLLEQD
jgi:uncharacterized protein YprB with RNaseH-like and TPR domain